MSILFLTGCFRGDWSGPRSITASKGITNSSSSTAAGGSVTSMQGASDSWQEPSPDSEAAVQDCENPGMEGHDFSFPQRKDSHIQCHLIRKCMHCECQGVRWVHHTWHSLMDIIFFLTECSRGAARESVVLLMAKSTVRKIKCLLREGERFWGKGTQLPLASNFYCHNAIRLQYSRKEITHCIVTQCRETA